MKLTRFGLFGIFFLTAMAAHATTLKCQTAPDNSPNVEATIETNWWGNTIYSGTFTYADPMTAEKRDNKFACLPADAKGITMCGAIATDPNISNIVAHPVMGLMIQFKDHRSITLLNCKEQK